MEIINTILLFLLVLLNIASLYLHYRNLPPEKKLEIQNKVTGNETVLMEWQPPESDEEIAFKESMKKLEEMRK